MVSFLANFKGFPHLQQMKFRHLYKSLRKIGNLIVEGLYGMDFARKLQNWIVAHFGLTEKQSYRLKGHPSDRRILVLKI
jgi:hypothetical protein